MPFLTEELWHQLPQEIGARSIALAQFPKDLDKWIDEEAESEFDQVRKAVTVQRDVLAEYKIKSKGTVSVYTPTASQVLTSNVAAVVYHSGANQILDSPPPGVTPFAERQLPDSQKMYFVRVGTTVDYRAEAEKLRKDIERLSKDILAKKERLKDQTFRSRAPDHIVKGMEATLAQRQAEFVALRDQLTQLERQADYGRLLDPGKDTDKKPL